MRSPPLRGIGLILLSLASGNPIQASDARTLEEKTLLRFHDPVIVQTSGLRDLSDQSTANLRLYAAQDGVLVPIPFQFDARDKQGDLEFPEEPSAAEATFDDNDELIFMAKDTGDRLTASDLPAGAGRAVEIQVTDPQTDERGWAYMVHFPNEPPPPSPVTYATFDPKTNTARTQFYTIEYFPGHNFFTGMSITPAAGGSGENLLDRLKVRISLTFSMLLIRWSPMFTEEDFGVSIDGIKNGPVRAVRRVRQWLKLGRFFPDVPGGTVYSYYYFSSLMTPSEFRLPWVVSKAVRDVRFTGVSDFNEKVIGMTYWDAANPAGLRFTGQNREAVTTTQDHEWWVLSGDGGTCLHVLLIPEEWKRRGVIRGTVFLDDDTAIDEEGSESNPGSHAVGYSLQNLTRVTRAEEHHMNLATIILPNAYRPGDEVQPMAMITQPLRAEVAPVSEASPLRP